MNNKKRIILTSAITIAVCFAIITGSTFALFTGDDSYNVAITSGNLKVTANHIKTDNNGQNVDYIVGSELTDEDDNALAPICEPTLSQNAIALNYMVPGDYVKFSVIVKNEGDIAVDCTVGFEQKVLTATESPAGMAAGNINKLWNALKVDVEMVVDGTTTKMFTNEPINSVAFTSKTSAMLLEKGESAVFVITVKFPNSTVDGVDNAYIHTNCAFTYAVNAVQHNDKVNP